MSNLRQTPLTCSGHTRPVVQLAFSGIVESGYFVISACKDGKPMLRQGDTGDWIGTFEGHKGAVWGVALNHDATKAASVKSVDFSRDGALFATGSNEKLIRIFDLNKPEESPTVFSGHTAAIKHALFFRNGGYLVSCADDRTLRVWDRSSGEEVQKLEFSAIPSSLEVSQDGTVITVTHGKVVSFWNADTLEKVKEVSVPTQVNSASLHPDKSIFICGGEDLKVYKFDYNTGNEIESFKGHFGPVHCVRFSPDGELYASGSEDGTLRLWQTTVGKTYGLWKCVDGVAAPIPDPVAPPKQQEVTAS
ncbi:hypothetical protein B566_EDAN004047 [Ephemera danica]|nr:hypothetical protein B566_EDAN004047 [Ephemera danica]